ncbi:MAG: hypothetical protein QM296_00450 [Bacillota bacterium]|nr:hypothetical protein [Bacillota bacterium]
MSKGGQKLRWCPENGAGTKKLSTDGQKLRWCPETGAGAEKLATDGQKLRWCPETGAGAEKLATGGQNRFTKCARHRNLPSQLIATEINRLETAKIDIMQSLRHQRFIPFVP